MRPYNRRKVLWPLKLGLHYRSIRAQIAYTKTRDTKLFTVENILADVKSIIFPEFWSQPNSPNLSHQTLYLGVKSISACLNTIRAQIISHIQRSYFTPGTKAPLLLKKRDENLQIWLDTLNFTLEKETFMSSEVCIISLFVDRLKAQCGTLLTFSSVPDFVNIKCQLPKNYDENSQARLLLFIAFFCLEAEIA